MPEAASATSLDPLVLASSVFWRLNLWTLDDYGIHAAARRRSGFSRILFRLVIPVARRLSRCLFVIAILITIATVHGRYHYLAGRRGRPHRAGSRASRNDKCQSFDIRRRSLCRVANQTCCVSNIFTASLSQRKLAHLVPFEGTTATSRKSST